MTTLSTEQLLNVEFVDDEDEEQPEPVLDIKPVQSKEKLTIDIEDLQTWLATGVLNKTGYIYLVLLLKFKGDVNVDIKSLADSLLFEIAIDDDKMKNFSFSEEEVIEAIAKLNKKGALTIKQTAIQLSLNL